MTPDEILRDALAKIAEQRGADAEQLGALRDEGAELERRVAEAMRAETALGVFLQGRASAEPEGAPEGSAPSAGGDPVPEVEKPPMVERLMEAGARVAALATASVPPSPAPAAALIPTRKEPSAGSEAAAALALAREAAPEKTDRQQRMLAGSALTVAYGLTQKEACAALDMNLCDMSRSVIEVARIQFKTIEAVAKELRGRCADAPGARPLASPQPPAKPAEAAKVPASVPEKPAEASATVRDLADDLLNDLPSLLATHPAGVAVTAIADWLGCSEDDARAAATLLIREGKAAAKDKRLVLAPEAVPA